MAYTSNWAKQIKRYQDVPGDYKEYLQDFAREQKDFPYTIYMPSDYWGKRRTNEKLLYVYKGKIYTYEKKGDQIIFLCYPFDNIIYIEHGQLLLYSWVKLCGYMEGQLYTTVMEYNTVMEELFIQTVSEIRSFYTGIDITTDIKKDWGPFESLKDIDYKFYNYAGSSIFPMEKVISIVYQPEIYTQKYRVFSKRVTPSHLIMLTDKELIHIKEGNATQRSASKYGGIWTYIPLNKIDTISVECGNDDLLLLKICLIDNSNLQLPFSITKEKELAKLSDYFK